MKEFLPARGGILSLGRARSGTRSAPMERKRENDGSGLGQLSRILGDHQLLVGGDDPDGDLGVFGGDDPLVAAELVLLGVELDAQEFQALKT